jgi:hypothetical protein
VKAASADKRLTRNPDVAVARLDGEMVLLDPKSGDCYTLNSVGCHVWDHADGTRTMSDLARHVAAAFDVTLDTATADLTALVEGLVKEGLASVDDHTAAAG